MTFFSLPKPNNRLAGFLLGLGLLTGPVFAFAATAPSAPQNVSAAAGDGLATITYSAPSSDGGSPIVAYNIVIVSPGLQDQAMSFNTSTSHTINGLKNGSTYSFKVAAVNNVGTGAYAITGTITPKPVVTTSGDGGATKTTSGDVNGGAQDISIQFAVKNPLGTSSTDLPGFVANVLNAIVDLLFPVVVIMLLYSGFLFVISRGNIEKLGDAKKALMYTLIGAAIVLGASGLAHVIQNTISAIAG